MSSPDHTAAVKAFEQVVARAAPQHLALALRTLARMQPERWGMEWYLPKWLGETFGLDRTHADTLVLINSLGLVSIRLQDDLADGERAEDEQDSMVELAHVLYQAALDLYRPYFPTSAVFWKRLDTYMDAWRAATATVNQLPLSDLDRFRKLQDPSTRRIADLGAPLKICVEAVCSLTAHAFSPPLDALLDHAFLAAVLHDHVIDCDADLRAGRWNLFAATISNLPQTPSCFREQIARINAAWMTTDTPLAYFQQITFHLNRARAINQRLRIQGLEVYLCELKTTIWRTHASLVSAHRADLERATKTIFGPTAFPARKSSKKGGRTFPVKPIH